MLGVGQGPGGEYAVALLHYKCVAADSILVAPLLKLTVWTGAAHHRLCGGEHERAAGVPLHAPSHPADYAALIPREPHTPQRQGRQRHRAGVQPTNITMPLFHLQRRTSYIWWKIRTVRNRAL